MEAPNDPEKPGLMKRLIDAMSSDEEAANKDADEVPGEAPEVRKKYDRDIVPAKLQSDSRAPILNDFNHKGSKPGKATSVRVLYYGLARHMALNTPDCPRSVESMQLLLDSRDLALGSLAD